MSGMASPPAPAPASPPGLEGSLLDALSLGIIVLDEQGRIVLWNRWMARHAGIAAESVAGRALLAVFPELQGKRLDSAVRQALRDNFPSVLSQTLHKAPLPLFASPAAQAAGERMQQAVAVTPVDLGTGARHCLIQVTDVSVAVHRERLLRDQALELRSQTFSDGLTGIANRRHFDVALEKEFRRAKRAGSPLSLLMIDIDSFKPYNDSYGHQQGDDTLIKVAGTLAAMLQRPLDLIARYGGEEFGVILPELDVVQAARLAETMRQRIFDLAIAHRSAPGFDRVTVSIGLATHSNEQSLDPAALLGAADRALYIAKHEGRNRVVVTDQP
jgi:diguanylate cyclase (GGDEF)-like protein/PAS domain S-box-containing protein